MFNIFRRKPPKVCPKCHRADGWRCTYGDSEPGNLVNLMRDNLTPGGTSNIFADSRIQHTRRRVIKYHCSLCGFEKSY